MTAAKIQQGTNIPHLQVEDIHGKMIDIPVKGAKFTHLQFRRYAGCPVCNLHLRSVTQRLGEIEAAGIREVVFFHSSAAALKPHVADFPVTIIGDEPRRWYRQFGVGKALSGLLHPKVFGDALKGLALKNLWTAITPAEDHTGLPADFLLDAKGKVVAAKYGTHASDQWTVDELLAAARPH